MSLQRLSKRSESLSRDKLKLKLKRHTEVLCHCHQTKYTVLSHQI
ncbi:hypothetical protein VPHD505_0061 [Vibrio phage D505]